MSDRAVSPEHAIVGTMSINEVLRRHPGTQPVMDRYHIDYCCGGHGTLAEAARDGRFDLDKFLAELNNAVAR